MKGTSTWYWRGTLAMCVMTLLSGSLLGGSPTLGQAQTAATSSKSHTKLLPEAPPPDESVDGASGFSSADENAGAEGEPSNVQVSRTNTGTLVDVVNPSGVVVGQRLTDCVRVGQSETTVVRNEVGIVAGYNNGMGFAGPPFNRGACSVQTSLSGFSFSTDGGQSWTVGGAMPVGNTIAFGPGAKGCSSSGRFVTRGDPWLDVRGDTFVYVNLAQWDDNGETKAFPCFAPAAGSVPTAGMSVHFGSFRNGGFTWNREVLVQSPNYPGDFLDKEAVAVDGGGIFITTTNFIETCGGVAANGFGQIELYRSLNGGETWDRRIIQGDETFVTNPADPNCGTDGVQNQGSEPAVGPDGELFVAFERGWEAPFIGGPPQGLPRPTIALRMSADRGATWGPLRTIKSICGQLHSPAGYNRTANNDFPRIAVVQAGPHRGRVYVAFQDCSATNGSAAFGLNTDVYLAHSDNNGLSWTIRPVHPTANGKWHIFPVVSVDSEGHVRVVYHEGQDVTPDPAHPTNIVCSVRIGGPLTNPTLRKSTTVSLVDVMEAVSDDGGQTFVNQRLTTRTTNWCKSTPINSIIPNFGDYIGGRGTGSGALTVWADGRNGSHLDFVPTVFGSSGSGE
jgi:hypothetical protein